jgi:hypothetical protein
LQQIRKDDGIASVGLMHRHASSLSGAPRAQMNPTLLPMRELDFLRQSKNYQELGRRLALLDCPVPKLAEYAKSVGMAWFRLGEQHLEESKKLLQIGCVRATYSRAYYAAYSASKCARYLVNGIVSLTGDDHEKASSKLPHDFPELARWTDAIAGLGAHRVCADYDNWATTMVDFTLTPHEAVKQAGEFVDLARFYLNSKCQTFL